MGLEIEIRLKEIVCSKASEEEDELYLTFDGHYRASKVQIKGRVPNGTVWKLKSGQTLGPNQVIFSGDIDSGLDIKLAFVEEDAAGLISVTDDVIGQIRFGIDNTGVYDWALLKYCSMIPSDTPGHHQFFLNGGKAEYKLIFTLYEKRPI